MARCAPSRSTSRSMRSTTNRRAPRPSQRSRRRLRWSSELVGEARLAPQELRHCLGPRPDLELFINAADVGVDRFVADAEFLGDLLVKKALAEAIKHLLLARREILGG